MKLKNLTRIAYFLVFILIMGFFLYDNAKRAITAKEEFNIRDYLKNPQRYGGQQIESMVKITSMSEDYFYVNLENTKIKIMGSGIKMPVLGQTAVFLDFRKDGTVKLIDYHNYNYNYVLYILSFFALIIFLIMLFKEWKITLRGFKSA